jgi:Protein of Unknown function (DUF2784)
VTQIFAALAALVVALHAAFALFAAFGSLLVVRRVHLAWLHVPCAIWAAYVELAGRTCPLTPLENVLRNRAGLDGYSSDFIARYVFPVLYPEGLTREAQVVLGSAVVAMNVAVYGWLLWCGSRKRHRGMAARRRRNGIST